VHSTIPLVSGLGFWRKLLAFSGPGYLVAVGYMDPGNWATDLAGGSAFGFTLHVADGWAARNYEQLRLAESEEMIADRQYLQDQADRLRQEGLRASIHLALGDPPTEILKTSEQEHCDLIAMTTHGHRLFRDLIHGSTITAVRHKSHIPLLLVRAMQI
jgi:nucleotide-binding universal stress UspA family protein